MTINRSNFEAYLLDYLEGNLDPLLTADLMAFLAENPEFEKYIPDFEIQPLIVRSGEFNDKQLLRKDFSDIPDITQDNFDEFCIASCEGLLRERDSLRLEAYIAHHSEKQKDLELFRALKLQPDLSIAYPGKTGLKKHAGRSFKMRYLYFGLSIAASVSLILLLTLNRKPNSNHTISSALPVTNEVTTGHTISNPSKDISQPGPVNSSPIKPITPAINDIVQRISNTADADIPPAEASQFQRENMQLAMLEPIKAELPIAGLPREMLLPKTNKVPDEPELQQKRTSPEWIDSESLLGTLISKVDFWKTAETAIDGFNYLTEARLSISKTTDENGNTNGLVLNTESYSIETK